VISETRYRASFCALADRQAFLTADRQARVVGSREPDEWLALRFDHLASVMDPAVAAA
jgi:hypothetical protein